jgi:hypothetical protein
MAKRKKETLPAGDKADASPEVLFIKPALAEYLASCDVPQGEWPAIVQRAIHRGGSNRDVEEEVQRWLLDHGRVMVSASSPILSDATQEKIRRQFARKSLDERVGAHLDRLALRDAVKWAMSAAVSDPPVSDGPLTKPMTQKELGEAFTCHRNQVRAKVLAKYKHKEDGKRFRMYVADMPAEWRVKHGLH